jgi:tRNA (cmo5U34)-methyltransferase
MNEFDIKAADWDLNPMHFDRSLAVANAIIKHIPLDHEMIVLEYGAGTGITSFILKDHVKEIILMDNSSEMVKVMNEKIQSKNAGNLKALEFNLETDDFSGMTFDLIFTQMVLHHVSDTVAILRKFHRLLNKGSYLVIADLYKEDGSFHGEGFTGHNGFNIKLLTDDLIKTGFSAVFHETCFTIERQVSETESRKFDIFLLAARKD